MDSLAGSSARCAWWSPTHAFKQDAGLEQRMAIGAKNGVSFREWGRLTAAIKENWSSLEWLLMIELKVEFPTKTIERGR